MNINDKLLRQRCSEVKVNNTLYLIELDHNVKTFGWIA